MSAPPSSSSFPPVLLSCIVTTFAVTSSFAAPALNYFENGRKSTVCGGSLGFREGRIIGGQEADMGEIPWIVSIQNKGSHFCGGSIIADRFILSAAHCFSHLEDDAQLSVVLGSHRIPVQEKDDKDNQEDKTTTSLLKFKRVSISKVTNHPDFDGGVQYLNDIAIIQLTEKIEWNSFISPICLPHNGGVFGRTAADKDKNISAVASGWGRTWGQKVERSELDFEELYKVHSDVLKTLNLTILPNSECDEYYQKKTTWNPMRLSTSQLCAGVVEKEWKEDTASGDSGGPLAIWQDGRWTIAGVTSFGTPYRAPGVYCRVSSYLEWIKGVITTTV